VGWFYPYRPSFFKVKFDHELIQNTQEKQMELTYRNGEHFLSNQSSATMLEINEPVICSGLMIKKMMYLLRDILSSGSILN
jgi:hypothetical protein